MMLYFTPLLPDSPQMLFGINLCCSLMNLVCDSVVHIFLKPWLLPFVNCVLFALPPCAMSGFLQS